MRIERNLVLKFIIAFGVLLPATGRPLFAIAGALVLLFADILIIRLRQPSIKNYFLSFIFYFAILLVLIQEPLLATGLALVFIIIDGAIRIVDDTQKWGNPKRR